MNEREAFEAWYRTQERLPQPSPWYKGIEFAIAWSAWQAALAWKAEQAQAEPVATVGTQSDTWKTLTWGNGEVSLTPPSRDPIKTVFLLKDVPIGTLLYTHPPKAETALELEEPLILAVYNGKDGKRQWASTGTWLYPGDALAQIKWAQKEKHNDGTN